jgi:hypothetical protein
MKQAYAPALEVREKTIVRKLRELPLPGKSLFSVGQEVTSNDVVLTAELPGDMSIIRVAERMGFEADDVLYGMQVKEGQYLEKGQLICSLKTFFGLFTSELRCPEAGTVEFFTESNAHIGIRHQAVPLEVNAYIDGVVVEVEEGKSLTIETAGTFIQGIFGVGGERQGEIFMLPDEKIPCVNSEVIEQISESIEGKVLVGGVAYDTSGLDAVAQRGVAAVVCGSIDAPTLFEYVGHEIGVSITGDEKVPCTLIVTEGFGNLEISERVLQLLRGAQGELASVNGATQVRAGATRPEIIIPRAQEANTNYEIDQKFLELGARIRIIRVPNFGAFGEIIDLPSDPMAVPSGAKVRVLKARLENGQEVFVPRANVELV